MIFNDNIRSDFTKTMNYAIIMNYVIIMNNAIIMNYAIISLIKINGVNFMTQTISSTKKG